MQLFLPYRHGCTANAKVQDFVVLQMSSVCNITNYLSGRSKDISK